MEKIIINGGKALNGTVKIGGAKNATLPLMVASLLSDKPLTLSNVPYLSDIITMAELLTSLGVGLKLDGLNSNRENGRVLSLDASNITKKRAEYDIVKRMRASSLVLGCLLARFGYTEVSLPGGCAIGTRPMDFHIAALEKMGADVKIESGYIKAKAPENGLRGADILFPRISVGATENIMMAATLANGTSIIQNAATEPEVKDLADCLIKMGANIKGAGTNIITIEGTSGKLLSGTFHRVMFDRIEATTYAIMAAITEGKIKITDVDNAILAPIFDYLRIMGLEIEEGIEKEEEGDDANSAYAIITRKYADNGNIQPLKPLNITTKEYPGFATDMQAQFMALFCLADGTSSIIETIFENRFMHIPELQRMGADIEVQANKAIINGIKQFTPAEVMATDLRASVSLVLAAVAAKGKSIINRVYHIDRGYERIEEKIATLGGNIQRIK